MKELILDSIEQFREREQGFDKNTMRWSKFYASPQHGIVRLFNKKDKGKYKDIVRLCDTTREYFASLDDVVLLSIHNTIIRQMSKQM